MKNPLINFFANPITQVISFSIVLVGSPIFGGPYLYFVIGAGTHGVLYGMLGIAGIILTLLSLAVKAKGFVQVAGLLLMLFSLCVLFYNDPPENREITFGNVAAIATVCLFVLACVAVIIKTFQKWKNS
ncbi:MAG: hypothetical protein V4539_04125 [Bacteroidota bacterium]